MDDWIVLVFTELQLEREDLKEDGGDVGGKVRIG